MVNAPSLLLTVPAARDRPDHERPGGRPPREGEADVPGRPSARARRQAAQRGECPADEPRGAHQTPRAAGGRVPLQEMWQVGEETLGLCLLRGTIQM